MKTRFWLGCIAAVAMTMHISVPAAAAELELSLRYLGSYDSSFAPKKPVLCPDCISMAEPDDYHAFGVYMRLLDALPNEDFQAVQFDIDLGPGLSPADFGGWIGNDVQFDPPGPVPPTSIWMDNLDAGSNPNDFVRILALSNNSAAMAALQLGEADPFLLGTAYVEWDTISSSTISIEPNGLDNWGTFIGGVPTAHFASSFSEGPADFFSACIIPEPASIGMALLAAIVALGLPLRSRGRQ
jgi:hypothetical protein